MKKFYKESQLVEVNNLLGGVINSISEIIEILDDNYVENRNVDNDLGEYIVI